MSYASTAALQEAVYGALSTDPDVASLSSGAIYDALPAGSVPSIYVSLGPEQVRDASDGTGSGAIHDFQVSVVTDAAGFQTAKVLAAAISDALSGASLALSRGNLTALNFLRARARRVENNREIEIWFRAFIDTNSA